MKKITTFLIMVSVFFWGSPALATALKPSDSGIIFNLSNSFFGSEPTLVLIMGIAMLSIAGFTKRKTKR